MDYSDFTNKEKENFEIVKNLCQTYSDTFLKDKNISNEEFVSDFKELIYSKSNHRNGIDQSRALEFDNAINFFVTNFAIDIKSRRK